MTIGDQCIICRKMLGSCNCMKKDFGYFKSSPSDEFDYKNCTIDDIKIIVQELLSEEREDRLALVYRNVLLNNFNVETRKFCFYELGKFYLNTIYDYHRAYYYLNELAETNTLDYPDVYDILSNCRSRLSSIYPKD
jgi:hypothetical protein